MSDSYDTDESKPKPTARAKRSVELRIKRLTEPMGQMFLSKYLHSSCVSFNLNPTLNIGFDDELPFIEKLFHFFTPFPLKSTLPLPVLDAMPTPTQVARGQDPVLTFLDKKEIRQRMLNKYVQTQERFRTKKEYKDVVENLLIQLKKLRRNASEENKKLEIPCALYKIAQAVRTNTDPTFDDTYYWYYTGGSVATMTLKGRTILAAARGQHGNQLHVNALKRDSNAPNGYRVKESATVALTMDDPTPIYQIESCDHETTGIICTRQREKCCAFLCSRDPSSNFTKIHQSTSVVPFTSIALSPYDETHLCTTNQIRDLLMWDIVKNKNTSYLVPNIKSKESRQWCGVHYSLKSRNIVYFTDHHVISIFDLRGYKPKSTLLELSGLSNLVETCEQITVAGSSVVSPYIQYVGTTHKLFSIDTRMPGKALQRWTHLLRGCPQFLSLSCDIPGREIVCLSSTYKSDLHAVVNEWVGENVEKFPVSRSQPFSLPIISDTLNRAKLQQLCLNPVVQSRLKLNMTGISTVSCYRPAIFSTTSAGDVFCQRLSPKYEEHDKEQEEELFTSKMLFWDRKIKDVDLEEPVMPLHQTDQVDASYVFHEVLMKQEPKVVQEPEAVQISEESDKDSNESFNFDFLDELKPAPANPYIPPGVSVSDAPPYIMDSSWQMTADELFNFQDCFSSRILEEWEIDRSSMWLQEQQKTTGLPSTSAPPMKRVEEWLSIVSPSQVSQTPMSQSIPDYPPTQNYFSQGGEELMSVSQQQPYSTTAYTPAGQDSILEFDKVLKPKKTPMKRRRTDGF